MYSIIQLILLTQSRLKQNLYKKYQQPISSWFSSDSHDGVQSSDSMTSPSSWQKSYIYTKHHPFSICNWKPTRVLILQRHTTFKYRQWIIRYDDIKDVTRRGYYSVLLFLKYIMRAIYSFNHAHGCTVLYNLFYSCT